MEDTAQFQERYRAVQARDARFDGQFVTAVSSTGIYCRPSCPARTPKPENVDFFLTSAAAHEAGYRACRRCLPEAVPGTPEWNLRTDLAARAMRLIREGAADADGVDGLSARLGYSSRHLHRTMVAELGAGPTALARAHRAQIARTLLCGTELKIADVAFAAGFGTVRQFNDTIREVFDATPGSIRGRSQTPQTSEGSETLHLPLRLPMREPFDAPGVFEFLAARAVPGVESVELTGGTLRYARTLRLPHGPGAVEVVAEPRDTASDQYRHRHWTLTMRSELSSLADVPAAVGATRRLFDLDADPQAVDAALSEDVQLAPLVATAPGIRLPGTADPQEYVTRAIIGQQISVAAARTHLTRLTERLGTPWHSAFEGLTTLFPTPREILRGVPDPADSVAADGSPDPDRPLRLPARSVRTVRRAAEALSTGELEVHSGVAQESLRERLTALPGIGRWTAAYLALRVLGAPDDWMTGDVALLAGATKAGVLDPDLPRPAAHRALEHHARRWSPWRSYAALHLWQAAASPASHDSASDDSASDHLAPKGPDHG